MGCRVTVSLGKKTLTGFIVDLVEALHSDEIEVRDIEEVLDDEPIIGPVILELTRWMSDYYYAPWGECLRAALPAGATTISERLIAITDAGRAELAHGTSGGAPETKLAALELLAGVETASARLLEREFSKQKAAAIIRSLEREGFIRTWQKAGEAGLKPRLENAVRRAGDTDGDGKPLNERQQRVMAELEKREPLGLSRLLELTGVSSSVVRTLERRGIVQVFSREVRRDPLAHLDTTNETGVSLTSDQAAALDQILERLSTGTYSTFLLHGVTGSGKTEIYIKSIRAALNLGKSALMLVPEISLTPIFSRRLRAEFSDTLAMIHSSLSEGERIDEWKRVKSGHARVVIGTRSAVFAPLENIGLIIVDEEHDTSYKQEESPRYNGRDTAIMRGHQVGAVVVLGSATPSVESYSNAQAGKYSLLKLEKRYGERALATVETVDMREVFKRHGKQQVLSDELKAAIAENHARGEQTLILLNRRGFSAFLLCRSCGLAVPCPNCDVTLTYHRYDSSLQCHYCGYIRPVPRTCDACDGQYIQYIGLGTEQLEARLTELYPAMRIARLDRDTARRRGSLEQIIMEFASGGIDLLVGTQMIAKGHDFPNVTLVGVVSIDAGLALPDFRASERTFQLLAQVAGRAGRGARPGRVLIQTYHPEHYSVQCARSQSYEEFYRREMEFRRAMSYPPFSVLINILVHHKQHETARELAEEVARHLREQAREHHLRVLGPAPAPLARLKGEHRVQILIKARSRSPAREALDIAMDRVIADGHSPRSIAIEVDPVNLM